MRPAWLYWSGRAHDQMGETAIANERYRLEVADYENSYYGRLSSKILETRDPATAGDNGSIVPTAADVQLPTAAVIRQLVGLELYDQALKELLYAQRAWGDTPAIEATVAWIHHEQAQNETAPDRFDHLRGAINTMKRAYPQYLASGGEELPPAVLEVIFPLDYWALIDKYSKANDLDPYLMAALIAQESTFTADVRSGANAYGLMQLLPATGRVYASKVGLGRFAPSMLTQPEANIRMGMRYFKDLADRLGGAHFALASYNAGPSKIVQWVAERPGLPQDEFIDDIPYPETQNYVKRILGTAEDYRRLYGGGLLLPGSLKNAPPQKPVRVTMSKPKPSRKAPVKKASAKKSKSSTSRTNKTR
jgi:soluble lytic murein transglycosylase